MSTPETSSETSSTSTETITSVSLKLPPFWPSDPSIWFAQVEAQFQTRNITSQPTKYHHVISVLPPEIAQEIRDILLNPPTSQQYDYLKSELIKRTSVSERKRLHQLLVAEELGDRKPTQLLRKMRQLLGNAELEERILRQLFLKRLPTNVQPILVSSVDTISLDQLATLADKILDVTSSSPLLSPLSATATPSVSTIDLQEQISQLTFAVQALQSQVSSRGRSPYRRSSFSSGSRRPSRSSSRSRHPNSECWYHWRFGVNARKCQSPCSFRSSSLGNGPTSD